jgi:hypothetical protein
VSGSPTPDADAGDLECDPRANAGLGFAPVGVTLQVPVLVFERAPEPFDKNLSIQRPRPSMEIWISAAANIPLNAALLVN